MGRAAGGRVAALADRVRDPAPHVEPRREVRGRGVSTAATNDAAPASRRTISTATSPPMQ
jgi:hypothetical protein